MRHAALVAWLCALAVPAWALPHDARVKLSPGTERFLKAGFPLVSAVVDPPGAFQAEGLGSGEVYVTIPPGAKGPATLLAVGADRLFAWDVCIGEDPACAAASPILAARSACPDLREITDDGKNYWAATLKDAKCLEALRTALAHADVPGEKLRLVLEEGVSLPLFRQVSESITKDPLCAGLTAGFYGPTLKLSGKAPRKAVDHALLVAFRAMPGRLSFDADRVTFTDAPPPAPAGPPPARLIPISDSLAAPLVKDAEDASPPEPKP